MSESKPPCYDGQNFFEFDASLMAWPGDRHTTSAPPPPGKVSFEEVYQKALAFMGEAAPPSIDFRSVPGSTDVAVLVDGVPACVLTLDEFRELLRRLEAEK